MKTAFITGISGQDGSYLAELLLEKDYCVHGLVRRASTINTTRLNHLRDDPRYGEDLLILHFGDLSDASALIRLVKDIQPDEIYNLAAMSHVKVSFETPEYTGDIDGLGTLRLLEAVRFLDKPTKFYQAGTSELYGSNSGDIQNESTPFYPRSPYAVAKLYSYWITKNYRESYNMFASNGILFNHCSPRRGATFVEAKIAKAAVAIRNKTQRCLLLGNIYSKRDYGHAKDYVRAMWLMLQHSIPDDFVVATGQAYIIKDVVNKIFELVDIPLTWHGEGIEEYATSPSGDTVVRIDPKYFRPAEVDYLCGDSSKIRATLGWETSYTFSDILSELVQYAVTDLQNSS
jgi:GDPmannose 4,6-dehydratase